MKSVEIKLIVDGVGEYILSGKEISSHLKDINWFNEGGSIEIEKNVIDRIEIKPLNYSYSALEILTETARQVYPNKNVSAIINWREID